MLLVLDFGVVWRCGNVGLYPKQGSFTITLDLAGRAPRVQKMFGPLGIPHLAAGQQLGGLNVL